MADPAVMETVETVETITPTEGKPGMVDALAMMRDGLRDTTPEPLEVADDEPTAAEGEPAAADDAPKSDETTRPSSRRAKTVEKVKTEAEQRIADIEAAREAAEARAAAAEAKIAEREAQEAEQRNAVATGKVTEEYSAWYGTKEEYDEAVRWSRMPNDSPDWDWDRHQQEVAKLNTFDKNRAMVGLVAQQAKEQGAIEKFREISADFIDKLVADLPEDKRAGYVNHKDGIPGAVRYYAETLYAPKIEALEDQIAQKDAEILRLQASTGGRRSPSPGAPSTGGTPQLSYRDMTPEQLMTAGLREQSRGARR